MDSYVSKRHRSEIASEDLPEAFVIDGIRATVEWDYSCVWDGGFATHDDEARILERFFIGLEQLSQDAEQSGTLSQLLSVIVANARQAVIWRRLLRLRGSTRRHIGLKIPSTALGRAPCLMWLPDTQDDEADFISSVFPRLGIEKANEN